MTIHAQNDLLNHFKPILPVQSPRQKYFPSGPTQITGISSAIPARTEGRIAIVTDVGHGEWWTRMASSAQTESQGGLP
jgi:hypothetical protein